MTVVVRGCSKFAVVVACFVISYCVVVVFRAIFVGRWLVAKNCRPDRPLLSTVPSSGAHPFEMCKHEKKERLSRRNRAGNCRAVVNVFFSIRLISNSVFVCGGDSRLKKRNPRAKPMENSANVQSTQFHAAATGRQLCRLVLGFLV